MAFERVAIVGAGLAGLAAAVELKELGKHVELFERGRLLGGRATSFEIDGIEVDNGQHVFLMCCKQLLGFIERVGFERDVKIQKRFDALVLARDGTRGRLRAEALPPPLHMLPGFATYPHLSAAGKLRIARALGSAMLGRIDGAATFEAWLVLRGQNAETRRAFWDPFFIPALNAPFDKVSVEDAMFTLRTAFLSTAGAARFGYATTPLAHLAAKAAQRADALHLQTAVLGIEPANDAVTLRLPNDETRAFDAVVLAVPPRATAKLLGDPAAYGVTGLDGYEPFPILDVHLWHDGGPIGFDFAAALESPLQWIFEKKTGYLSCSFSAASEYMALPTAELEALAWREVQAFVPEMQSANVIRSAVTRNPEATWLPKLGTQRTKHQTNDPRVAIAGGWTEAGGWPDTMEAAVRTGYAAARLLATSVVPSAASTRREVEGQTPNPVVLSAASKASKIEGPAHVR